MLKINLTVMLLMLLQEHRETTSAECAERLGVVWK